MDRRTFLKTSLQIGTGLCFSSLVGWRIIFGASEKYKLLTRGFYSMGTIGLIKLQADNKNIGITAAEEAIAKIHYLNNVLTKFSPTSDIGRLNAVPGKFVYVSQDTLNILKLGLQLTQRTDGYFDMGMGNFLSRFGLDEFVPIVGDASSLTQQDTQQKPLLEMNGRFVRLIRSNSMLDLGGIGKGYAVETAMQILREKYGIRHAVVELGGEIMVHGGMPNGKPWKIIFDPKAQDVMNKSPHDSNSLYLKTSGVASSGGYLKRAQNQKGKIKEHIVNPHTFSTNAFYSLVSVVGPSATTCDGLATAFYNIPPIKINSFKSRFPDYQFFFV